MATLWKTSIGTIPERLNFVNRDLDKWVKRVRHEKRIFISALRARIAHLSLLSLSDVVVEEMVNAKFQLNIKVEKKKYTRSNAHMQIG